jgi:hypothetical protein
VQGARAHRFRHTLATEILSNGGTVQDAADILGNSRRIIEKHYAKWIKARQERMSALRGWIFGTFVAREELESVSGRNENALAGGRHGVRTHDPHVANVVLSQLS